MLCHNDTVRDLKQENKAKCIIAFGFYSKLEKKRKNKRKENEQQQGKTQKQKKRAIEVKGEETTLKSSCATTLALNS